MLSGLPSLLQGLYRDSLIVTSAAAVAGGGAAAAGAAAALLVRLAVGSRTLFWLMLAFGYQLPPHLQVGGDRAL